MGELYNLLCIVDVLNKRGYMQMLKECQLLSLIEKIAIETDQSMLDLCTSNNAIAEKLIRDFNRDN